MTAAPETTANATSSESNENTTSETIINVTSSNPITIQPSVRKDANGLMVTAKTVTGKHVKGGLGNDNISKKGRDLAVNVSEINVGKDCRWFAKK
ncbi:hypothetical protein C8J56DRAFT_1160168 [Mycena floridula]|nr:hypothetical protein C8J56DRAFT_1160168 [Mycena floridula]